MDASNVKFKESNAGSDVDGGSTRRPVKKRKNRGSEDRGSLFSSLFHAAAGGTKVSGSGKTPLPAKGCGSASGQAASGCESGGWADSSKAVISGSGPDGAKYLSLRVESAGRGTLGLEIVAENGKAHLRVTALSSEACEWIKGKQPEIASIFERGGISLEGMTVSSGTSEDGAGGKDAAGVHGEAPVKSLQKKIAVVPFHGRDRAGKAGELIG